jgi:hypothetical protein
VQSLEVYQSLWAMEQRRPGEAEAPLEAMIDQIAAAGYAGVCLDLAVSDIPTAKAARPLLEARGLKSLFNGFPRDDDELRVMLDLARTHGAPFLSVIGQVMPRSVAAMADVVRRWLDIADAAGVPLLFETHRHGLLNDLYPTLDLLEAIPQLRLCADLSHFVVDREFALPAADADETMIGQVLDRSWAFQGRVASNEQVQVQLGFERHQPWVERFFAWWETGLSSWRARAPADATVTFLCELGPAPYAITGADGLELSDRWSEALLIRERIRAIWERLQRDSGGPPA